MVRGRVSPIARAPLRTMNGPAGLSRARLYRHRPEICVFTRVVAGHDPAVSAATTRQNVHLSNFRFGIAPSTTDNTRRSTAVAALLSGIFFDAHKAMRSPVPASGIIGARACIVTPWSAISADFNIPTELISMTFCSARPATRAICSTRGRTPCFQCDAKAAWRKS